MNKKRYEACVGFFNKNKAANTALKIAYKALPILILVAYPSLLICEFIIGGVSSLLLKLVLIPLEVLVLVNILRYVINAERPYERYGIPSVFHKQTIRQSMPSRHTASAFIIAMTFLYVNTSLGAAFMVIALLIALSRVLAGAHFIRDVSVGAAIAIASGFIYYLV